MEQVTGTRQISLGLKGEVQKAPKDKYKLKINKNLEVVSVQMVLKVRRIYEITNGKDGGKKEVQGLILGVTPGYDREMKRKQQR